MAKSIGLDDIIAFLRKRGHRLSSGASGNVIGYLAAQLDAWHAQDQIRDAVRIGGQDGVLEVVMSSSVHFHSIGLAEWSASPEAEADLVPADSEVWDLVIELRRRVRTLEAAQAPVPEQEAPAVVQEPLIKPAVAQACSLCAAKDAEIARVSGLLRGAENEKRLALEQATTADQRVAGMHAEVSVLRRHECRAEPVGYMFLQLKCGCKLIRDASGCNGASNGALVVMPEQRVPRSDRKEMRALHQQSDSIDRVSVRI